MANYDPFMRKLLDRREQSRKDGERLRVRQEVREEVKAEALVELQPELERMEVLKERARFEVMAELQEERKGIDEEVPRWCGCGCASVRRNRPICVGR